MNESDMSTRYQPGLSAETIRSVTKTTLANARRHLTALAEFAMTAATLDQPGVAV